MTTSLRPNSELPGWVPAEVRRYLTHTESGRSLRAIARDEGLHASTVMRQIRRFENRRDDPLIDGALGRLRRQRPKPRAQPPGAGGGAEAALDEAHLLAEARRVLRRMSEPGALMAVAADMERAVVLRDGPAGAVRLAVLERPVAEAFALRDWIACRKPGRVARYEITAAGRQVLRELLDGVVAPAAVAPLPQIGSRPRPALGESPVSTLARRRDREGNPFLAPELVAAAERLREDFEIAQMSPRGAQNWERFLSAPRPGTKTESTEAESTEAEMPVLAQPGCAQRAARARVAAALRELGPGLGDMVLRCCCRLEGLESAERRLGWSARSGKIVLRIALMRLHRYFTDLGDTAKMMG